MSSMSAGSAKTTWMRDRVGAEDVAELVEVHRLAGRLEQVRGDRQPALARQPDQHPVVVERHREGGVRRHAGRTRSVVVSASSRDSVRARRSGQSLNPSTYTIARRPASAAASATAPE